MKLIEMLLNERSDEQNIDTFETEVGGTQSLWNPRLVDPGLGTKYLIPSTWYHTLDTKYLVPSTWYEVLGTKFLEPST